MSGMDDFLLLARKVKTQAGVEHFDKPIGEKISDQIENAQRQADGAASKGSAPDKKAKTGEDSPEQSSAARVRALNAQIEAAREAKDDSEVERLVAELRSELIGLTKDRTPAEVAALLNRGESAEEK